MIRWIAMLLALLALSGCVTTREVVYRDAHYSDRYDDRRYSDSDGYYDDRYYERDGSYYAPSYGGRGDYYTSAPDYYASGYPSWYVDYPAYYSLFWGFNRTWYDPYWYPNYYYGVTYYPRNYFSIGFGSGWGSHYAYQYYSPYRYSWVDNYYDWSPWHHHSHHRNRPTSPRFGSARNEAERLARISDGYRGYGGRGDGGYGGRGYGVRDGRGTRADAVSIFDRYGSARGNARAADYGDRADPRLSAGAGGYRADRSVDARRNPAREGRYGAFDARESSDRGFPAGDSRNAGQDARREISRYGNQPAQRAYPQYEAARTQRGVEAGVPLPRDGGRSMSRPSAPYERSYDRGSYSRGSEASTPRQYSRPPMPPRGYDAAPQADSGYRMPQRERYNAPTQESRGYAPAPESRSYSAPSRGYDTGAAAPRYSEPAARFESRAEPAPRYESRQESQQDRSSSSDRGAHDGDRKQDE